jgi:hypothetical protein
MQRTGSFQKNSTLCSVGYIKKYVILILSFDSNLECDRSVQFWGAGRVFIAVCFALQGARWRSG